MMLIHFFKSNSHFISVAILSVFLSGGCARHKLVPEVEETAPKEKEIAEMRAHLTSLTSKIEGLEGKLASMNDKVNITQTSVDNLLNIKSPKISAVLSDPTLQAGQSVEPKSNPNDPESGFINDSAVQSYRQSLVLFKGGKHSEAILAFSTFLEDYPDHPLAGSAQYYVGECYYQNKEFKLAHDEFSRVLTSYDRSPHIPITLKQLAFTSESLKNQEEAAKYRQLLSSLFPQSPASAESKKEVDSIQNTPHSALDDPPPTAPLQEEKPE